MQSLRDRYGDEFVIDESSMSHSAQKQLFEKPNLFSTPWTILGCDGEYVSSHDTDGALVCWYSQGEHLGEFDDYCNWDDETIDAILEEHQDNQAFVTALTTTKRSSWKRFCFIPFEEATGAWYVHTDKGSPYFQHVVQISREDAFDCLYVGSCLDETSTKQVVDHILTIFDVFVNNT